MNFTNALSGREAQPYEALLGTLLANTALYAEYSNALNEEMFYEYGWLYRIICELDGQDDLSYKTIMRTCDIHQLKTVNDLRLTALSERRIPDLIKQSKSILLTDHLRGIGNRLYRVTRDDDPDELLRELHKRVDELETTEVSNMSNPVKDIDDYANRVMEIVKDPSKAFGLLTGIDEIDRITTGFHRKDFSVVGARTSMGKSAFMLQLVLTLHMRGYKVAVFSLEMSKQQIYNRLMANLLNVHLELFRTGQCDKAYYDRMMESRNLLYGLYVDDTRGVSSEYIADTMKRLKRSQGLDFVVVDYLQDVAEKGEHNDNTGSAIARICRKLRAAAQASDCHMMGLSQVKRIEDRNDKRPMNSDLSGSTGIETCADVIALLYREDAYNPDTEKKGILEVNFTKQRNGKTGKVELFYDRNTQRISSLRR